MDNSTAIRRLNASLDAGSTLQLKQIIATQHLLGSADFDLQAFMDTVVERMQGLTAATGAVVELVDGDQLVHRAASGSVAPYVGLRLRIAGTLSGLSVASNEIIIANDTARDPRVNQDVCRKVGARSMIIVPLRQRGVAVGVLKVVSSRPEAFTETDVQFLQMMSGLLGSALGQQLEMERRKTLEEQLRQMAQTDSLTGVPNRALFQDRLQQALRLNTRQGGLLALMYMDIDHFKSVNDTRGHLVGDALLRAFANRIGGMVRKSDTFARLGGDEFTLVAPVVAAAEAAGLAGKIAAAAREPFDLDGTRLAVSSSIGVALATASLTEADELLRRADLALYSAKAAGRACFKFYRDTSHPSATG